MEFSIREYIREIKNSVNARLDMLESLISSKNVDKVEILNSKIQVLEAKIDELISSKKEELPSIIGIPNYDIVNVKNDYYNNLILSSDEETVDVLNKNIEVEEQEEEQEEEQVEEQVEEQEEEQVEEQEEEQEEEQVEEQEEEQVEEQEEEALIEFEYKGMVLYRDAENKVYQIDDEGELVDTPIGIWNEVKQKVVAIKN